MTETPTNGSDEPRSIDADPALQFLVVLTHQAAIQNLAVTLFIDGQIITGTLISRIRWSELRRSAAVGDQAGTDLAGVLERFLVQSYPESADDPVDGYEFIHLADAQLVGGPHFNGGILWRGRLSSVSAWANGRVTRTP